MQFPPDQLLTQQSPFVARQKIRKRVMSKENQLPIPRSLKTADYRYTIDEFILRLVAYDDGRVIFTDVCNLHDYDFHQKPNENVCKELAAATDNYMGQIFSAYIVDEDTVNDEYCDKYWDSTVPAGNLFKHWCVTADCCGGLEYPAAKLDKRHSYPSALHILHSIPIKALTEWLTFVGREFSAIPKATSDSPAPFDTFVM